MIHHLRSCCGSTKTRLQIHARARFPSNDPLIKIKFIIKSFVSLNYAYLINCRCLVLVRGWRLLNLKRSAVSWTSGSKTTFFRFLQGLLDGGRSWSYLGVILNGVLNFRSLKETTRNYTTFHLISCWSGGIQYWLQNNTDIITWFSLASSLVQLKQ